MFSPEYPTPTPRQSSAVGPWLPDDWKENDNTFDTSILANSEQQIQGILHIVCACTSVCVCVYNIVYQFSNSICWTLQSYY